MAKKILFYLSSCKNFLIFMQLLCRFKPVMMKKVLDRIGLNEAFPSGIERMRFYESCKAPERLACKAGRKIFRLKNDFFCKKVLT